MDEWIHELVVVVDVQPADTGMKEKRGKHKMDQKQREQAQGEIRPGPGLGLGQVAAWL